MFLDEHWLQRGNLNRLTNILMGRGKDISRLTPNLQ